jgi:hypothetical protein
MNKPATQLLVCLIYLFLGATIVSAQLSSSGIAISTPIADTNVQDGDIICTYELGNQLCNSDYDTAIYGVVSDNPAAAVVDDELADARLVITSGITTVRVDSSNGNIAEGDFVTTSDRAGIGIRADRNGYVLGMALEGYESGDTNAVGRIQVMVNIHPTGALTGSRGNLLQFIREGLAVPVFNPVESLRYLLAVAIVLISFTLGMIYFGRASRAGIEAIGRNPLAKRVIQLTVVMNITLTIVIVLVGLAIAYLILIF